MVLSIFTPPPLCHWCTARLNRLPGRGDSTNAVGVCHACHVHACHGHGVYDADRDQFICAPSLVRALGGSSGALLAGLPDLWFPTIRRFNRTVLDLGPIVGEEREVSEEDGDVQRIRQVLGERAEYIDMPLAVGAVRLARFLLEPSNLPTSRYRLIVGDELAALMLDSETDGHRLGQGEDEVVGAP